MNKIDILSHVATKHERFSSNNSFIVDHICKGRNITGIRKIKSNLIS